MLKYILNQGEKEFDRDFPQRDIPDAIEGWWQDIPNPKDLKSHIKQRELRILEGVRKMCEKAINYEKSAKPADHTEEIYEFGYCLALTDLISQLDQVIKEIK